MIPITLKAMFPFGNIGSERVNAIFVVSDYKSGMEKTILKVDIQALMKSPLARARIVPRFHVLLIALAFAGSA